MYDWERVERSWGSFEVFIEVILKVLDLDFGDFHELRFCCR